jgi:hypothetical protein
MISQRLKDQFGLHIEQDNRKRWMDEKDSTVGIIWSFNIIALISDWKNQTKKKFPKYDEL